MARPSPTTILADGSGIPRAAPIASVPSATNVSNTNQSSGSDGALTSSVGIVPAFLVDGYRSRVTPLRYQTLAASLPLDGETALTESTSTRTQVLDRLARYIANKSLTHPLRVAIDGRTAAGKPTIADELVAPLQRLGRNVIRVEIDNFHQPLAVRRARQDAPPWQQYYLDSYDLSAIRTELLLPLGPEGNRRYRRAIFDSLHDSVIDESTLLAPPDAVVLIDGVFLFRPELDDQWDVRIYIDVDAEDSLDRGPHRDVA